MGGKLYFAAITSRALRQHSNYCTRINRLILIDINFKGRRENKEKLHKYSDARQFIRAEYVCSTMNEINYENRPESNENFCLKSIQSLTKLAKLLQSTLRVCRYVLIPRPFFAVCYNMWF